MKKLLESFVAKIARRLTWFPPRIRGWWTASHPKIRAICKSGPTSRIRAKPISRKSPRGSSAKFPTDKPVHFPVNAVLAGRRNSPPDPEIGLPPLAVYNPIHYQELPELFMEFVSSLTGKSPSTTGFGSEGALTKAPFNALWPVVDLNNALVSAIVTGYAGFTTSAGYVGPEVPRGSRCQHAGAGNLVPHARPRAPSPVS